MTDFDVSAKQITQNKRTFVLLNVPATLCALYCQIPPPLSSFCFFCGIVLEPRLH